MDGFLMTTFYIKNKELVAEILHCQQTGQISEKVSKYFITLANKLSAKFYFDSLQDKEDAVQDVVLQLLSNWEGFDVTKTTNAFAYYTEIAKRKFVHSHLFRTESLRGKDFKYVSLNFKVEDGDDFRF
jgi:DNA-directed RNA polymerase specialized sigma24 family protein